MTPEPGGKHDNPYVGLRAFRRGETLYGRDREANNLLDLLIAERTVLLHAPSGAGKTSLVEAKLTPLLAEEGLKVKPLIRVNTPLPATAAGLKAANRYIFSTLSSLEQEYALAQRAAPEDLARIGLEHYFGLSGTGEREDLVLVFDQFEEVLTADETDLAAKKEFFVSVGALCATGTSGGCSASVKTSSPRSIPTCARCPAGSGSTCWMSPQRWRPYAGPP